MIKIIQNDIDKLIEDNINLAYKVFWKYYPVAKNYIEFDDGVSICLQGLVKAASTYNTSKGIAFSTYAFTVMKNELFGVLRQTQQKNKYTVISLDSEIYNDDSQCNFEYFISDSFNLEEYIEDKITNDILYECINSLSTDDKRIISLYMQGLTQQQIGCILNVSQPQINRKLKHIINTLRNKLKQKGVM